jgi:hypothetical protein
MRHVPTGLAARAAVFTVSGLVACGLLLHGQLMAWIFLPMADLAFLAGGPVERGTGTVLDVRATSATVNKRRVMAVEFEHAGGRGTSYGNDRLPRPGSTVELEWPEGRPEAARIVGLRGELMPPTVLAAPIVPAAVGVVFGLFAIRTGRRRVRLLHEGRLATGRVTALEPTNTRVNKKRVHRVRLSVEGREAVVRTQHIEALPVGADAPLLYDPDSGAALLVDQVPGKPRITEVAVDGVAGPLGVVALLVPALAIGGWAAVAWFFLMSR